MLNKAQSDILKSIGFDLDKLETALTSNVEVEIDMPKGSFYSDEALTTRDENLIKEHKPNFIKEGKEAGLSIASKEFVKEFGLTLENPKDLKTVVNAVKETLSTGDKGLKEQIDLLSKDRDKAIQDREEALNGIKQVQFDSNLLNSFPANRSKVLNDNEYLNVIKANLQFEEVDGVPVVKRNGEILRDEKSRNPLQQKDAISNLFAERKWVENANTGVNAGRGGNDNSPNGSGGIKSFSGAIEKWKSENPNGNTLSKECLSYVDTLAKGSTDFDYNA